MLYYILYVSKANKISEQGLKDILAESVKWNHAHGITGMLLYVEGSFWKSVKRKLLSVQSGRFVQLLEGKKADVEEVFNLISTDKRHNEIEIVSQSPCETRHFEAWDMGFKSLALDEYKSLEGFFELDDDFLAVHTQSPNAPLQFIKSFYEMSKIKV